MRYAMQENFLLVLIELFSLSVTAEALRAIICSKSAISVQRGSVDVKFQVEGVAPTNHSFYQKNRINDLSYGVKIWTDFSFVLPQCTRLTDRQTDRIARPRLHSMQRGKYQRRALIYELLWTLSKWRITRIDESFL